jgi:hypothetical protein
MERTLDPQPATVNGNFVKVNASAAPIHFFEEAEEGRGSIPSAGK